MAELHFYDDIVIGVSKEGVKVDNDKLREQTFTILDYITEHPQEKIELYGNMLSLSLALELGVRIAEERGKDEKSAYVAQKLKAIQEMWSNEADSTCEQEPGTLKRLAEAIVTVALYSEGAEAE